MIIESNEEEEEEEDEEEEEYSKIDNQFENALKNNEIDLPYLEEDDIENRNADACNNIFILIYLINFIQ